MTRFVGLTGGIACGKSTVSKELVARGIPVVDCDVIARQVVEPGKPAFNAIVREFGTEIVLLDGSGLDRPKLGEIVFKDAAQRAKLTRITGPAIFKAIISQLFRYFMVGTPIVIIDAPTLFETKTLVNVCSAVIVVAATQEHQVERMQRRDKFSTEQAMDRIQAQLPVEDKVKMADIVIPNDGSLEELIAETSRVVETLEKKYKYGPSLFLCGPTFVLLALVVALSVAWSRFIRPRSPM